MRRWKVIDGGNFIFRVGEIITLCKDDGSHTPKFFTHKTDHEWGFCNTNRLVEIDEDGNTIRTYKEGDKLNEGTLVGGNMDKKKAMERLDAIENEAKELRKILEKPDRIEYDSDVIYVAQENHSVYFLAGCNDTYAFYTLSASELRFNPAASSGQDAIDEMISDGFVIHTFTNRNDALKFMMENS